jgi:hypothetical protein
MIVVSLRKAQSVGADPALRRVVGCPKVRTLKTIRDFEGTKSRSQTMAGRDDYGHQKSRKNRLVQRALPPPLDRTRSNYSATSQAPRFVAKDLEQARQRSSSECNIRLCRCWHHLPERLRHLRQPLLAFLFYSMKHKEQSYEH